MSFQADALRSKQNQPSPPCGLHFNGVLRKSRILEARWTVRVNILEKEAQENKVSERGPKRIPKIDWLVDWFGWLACWLGSSNLVVY